MTTETDLKMFSNTLFWGLILWLLGFVLGILFFPLVPKEHIGYYILPIGVAVTIWVLLKKIKRESLKSYFMVGFFWTLMAIILDYFFIVLLFASHDYYKPDVYLYYIMTLILPLIVGWHILQKKR